MSTTVVQLRGGKGLTAAEQAFIAGQIAEPTQTALDAYLRAPALEAATQARADVDGLIAATGEAFGQEKAALDAHVDARDVEIDDAISAASDATTFASDQGEFARTQGNFSKDAGDAALAKAAAAQAAVDAAAPILAGADILGARTQAVGSAAAALQSASRIGGLNDNLSGLYVTLTSTEWTPLFGGTNGDLLLALRAGAGGVAEFLINANVIGDGVSNAVTDKIIPLAGLATTLQTTSLDVLLAAPDDGTIIFGFDPATGRPIIHAIEEIIADNVGIVRAPTMLDAAQRPDVVEWRGVVWNGESLSIGATGNPALNITPVYANRTFTAGPKATKAGSSAGGSNPGTNGSKLLVEDDLYGDGKTGRGQTMCFTAAKGAVERGALTRGVDPNSYVWFASAAGHGGYRVSDLDARGDVFSQNLVDHVTDARAAALAVAKSYALTAMPIIFGVNDAVAGITRTDFAAGERSMIEWQTTAAMAITGQAVKPHVLLTQSPIYAATNPGPALATMDVAQDPFVHFVCPMYQFPHDPIDKLHLTNVGYAWCGYYLGRALDQLVAGQEPSSIKLVRSFIRGRVITIYLDTPTGLKLNTTIGKVADFGFAVGPKGATLAISSVVASASTVTITLAADPAGVPEVRYALDYGLPGLLAGSGAGNLSDSTQDKVTIAGASYSLAHWAPAFISTPIRLEPA
jgi:hypothetical protein